MLQPLQLGDRTFPVNIIQGPLAGISCAPFRRLVWEYGKPAFACTEMISCKTLLHQDRSQQRRYVAKDPAEGPVCFQLSGSDPHELAEATKIATDCGADLIDLNCGCPVNKIRRRGAGSRLLTSPAQLYHLMVAMKQSTHVPVSIKIRVEGADETFNQEIAQVVSESGIDFLVVHGRHWTEHYETPCRHDAIQFFVDALKIPVIGNGDIACVASLRRMFATGCQGVMIGRAGVGQPWLIQQLVAEMEQKDFVMPSIEERGRMFFTHVVQLVALMGAEKFAILQARTFAKYYARGLPIREAFVHAVNGCESLQDLQRICERYFSG